MTRLTAAARPLASAYDLALLDLDGVVYLLEEPIPEAAAAVAALPGFGCEPVFVTNNASRSPEAVAEALRAMDVPAEADQVLTSAQAVAEGIVQYAGPDAAVLCVGSPALRAALEAEGLATIDEPGEAEAVAFGMTFDLGWRDLAAVTVAARSGAFWAVTNLDDTLPTPDGPLPGTGALGRAVSTALGRGPDLVAGKPQRPIFDSALARKPGARALMVGDRPDSDIEGANAAGIDSLLVFTGVTEPASALGLPADRRPTYLGWSIGALAEPHPEVRLGESTAECGGWTAVLDGGELVLSGEGAELDGWRALCEIAWAAADQGRYDAGRAPRAGSGAAEKLLA